MKKLLIVGACGRMGSMIAGMAPDHGLLPACGLDRGEASGLTFPVHADFSRVDIACDVLIDFSTPGMLPALLSHALKNKMPCVLGTTGYTEKDLEAIQSAARHIPIFYSRNMSRGIYVLKQLAARARDLLPGFDIEIIETHHNQKQDSPSGTALSLLTAVSAPDTLPVFGREGKTCKREPAEIGVHAVRGGTVAGDHEVGFYGNHEVLTLSHSAQSRLIFALGALKAAGFIITQPPGLYGMEDLLK